MGRDNHPLAAVAGVTEMNDWQCNKCKKSFSRDALTGIYGWRLCSCASCIEKWLQDNKATEWFDVKDKLPPLLKKVLVYTDDHRMFDAWYAYETWYEFDKNQTFDIAGITHWMPLPEVPK